MFFSKKSDRRNIDELERKLDRANTNHVLHLLLSIFTAWVWIPMWLAVWLSNVMYRSRLNRTIDKAYDNMEINFGSN